MHGQQVKSPRLIPMNRGGRGGRGESARRTVDTKRLTVVSPTRRPLGTSKQKQLKFSPGGAFSSLFFRGGVEEARASRLLVFLWVSMAKRTRSRGDARAGRVLSFFPHSSGDLAVPQTARAKIAAINSLVKLIFIGARSRSPLKRVNFAPTTTEMRDESRRSYFIFARSRKPHNNVFYARIPPSVRLLAARPERRASIPACYAVGTRVVNQYAREKTEKREKGEKRVPTGARAPGARCVEKYDNPRINAMPI